MKTATKIQRGEERKGDNRRKMSFKKMGNVGSNATSSHPTEMNSALIMHHVVLFFL